MTEQEFKDIEPQSAFKCPDCDNTTEDQPDNPSYECGNCGNAWNKANAEEGHRCTDCGKFASKNNAHCCEECESPEDVEEVEAYSCPDCDELVEEGEWVDHYETHLVEAEAKEKPKTIGDVLKEAADAKAEIEQKERTCIICGIPFSGYGNNAEPVKTGRACDICNDIVVIRRRIFDKQSPRDTIACDPLTDEMPNCST